MLGSPVIEKRKKKKSGDGTQCVRQNAEVTLGKEKKGFSGAFPADR